MRHAGWLVNESGWVSSAGPARLVQLGWSSSAGSARLGQLVQQWCLFWHLIVQTVQPRCVRTCLCSTWAVGCVMLLLLTAGACVVCRVLVLAAACAGCPRLMRAPLFACWCCATACCVSHGRHDVLCNHEAGGASQLRCKAVAL